VIERLSKFLPKSEGYGVYVPVSRQQVGCDFIIVQRHRMLRVQVKSSRHFEWSRSPTLRFWYRNFLGSYRPGATDVFILFGLYPVFEQGHTVSDRRAHWRNLVLIFEDGEMNRILKRTGDDRFFQFGIDPTIARKVSKVSGTRGGVKGRNLTSYLLEKRVGWLRRQLKTRHRTTLR
jgi:hypothetical protein